MSNNYRIVAIAAAAIAALVVVAGLLFLPPRAEAQGNADTSANAGRDIFSVSPDQAIRLAGATPDDWDYDPSEREIHPEGVELDYPIELSENEWRSLLDPQQYYILRQMGTEPAFTHPLNNNKERGIYYSAATGQPLFHSDDKYDSRSGWPSFTKPINPHAIVYVEDNSFFAQRIEVVDSLSGSHLGHVFSDGPRPTGQRYCINGAALIFVPEGEDPPPIRTAAAP
jgi:peptide-methionine (R)-S-oxide reductase